MHFIILRFLRYMINAIKWSLDAEINKQISVISRLNICLCIEQELFRNICSRIYHTLLQAYVWPSIYIARLVFLKLLTLTVVKANLNATPCNRASLVPATNISMVDDATSDLYGFSLVKQSIATNVIALYKLVNCTVKTQSLNCRI